MAQKDSSIRHNLLRYGADVNLIDEACQSTPLVLAARWGHTDMVKLLLDHGAVPKSAGADWSTPQDWSKIKGIKKLQPVKITPMKIESVIPILYSEDVARNIQFYTEVLGFKEHWS